MNSQNRHVNIDPAPIKFFHNNPTAVGPTGFNLNGARFFFVGLLTHCPRFARIDATFSAMRFEASTDASSNATSARITHQ